MRGNAVFTGQERKLGGSLVVLVTSTCSVAFDKCLRGQAAVGTVERRKGLEDPGNRGQAHQGWGEKLVVGARHAAGDLLGHRGISYFKMQIALVTFSF